MCSSCKRPWHSILLKTCRDCRQRARDRYRARRHAATMQNTDLSTNLSPFEMIRTKRSKLLPLPIPLPALLPRPQTDYCLQPQETPRSRDNRERSLAQLITTSPRAHNLFIDESRYQQRAARNQMRLYPKPNNQECLAEQALNFLRQDLHSRVEASNAFPPYLSPAHIRSAMRRYEDAIEDATNRDICASCGSILHFTDIHTVAKEDPRLQLQCGKLDECGKHGDTWNICSICLSSLSRQTIPKFSAANLVNITLCQSYPSILQDLTPVEECLIAKCHPVGIVLKLRPGGHSSPASYHAIRGHFIVIPQDPKPLLHILPSPVLNLDNLIKVLWAGKQSPADEDLTPFLLVRKLKVLAGLQYLVQHNKVYQDVDINHPMIDDWADDFIPPELRDNIISLDEPDSGEREGYTVNLSTGNYENEFQEAQDTSFDAGESEPLTTGSVSTDINSERQNPDKRLLNTLLELVSNSFQPGKEHTTRQCNKQHESSCNKRKGPVIYYRMRGQISLLDQWTDPRYFTAAFPTLFPTGIGGHLEDRPFPVSLGSFMEWALKHHSRRYVLSTSTQFLC